MTTNPIMKFFQFEHLRDGILRQTSAKVHRLAEEIDSTIPDCPEKSAGMRKLLEAKDCFVRAALPVMIASVVLLSATPSHARSLGDRLRTLPTEEYLYQGAHVADCAITQYLISSGKGRETNPLYGNHPTSLRLWSICAATGAVSALGVSLIQDRDPKAARTVARVKLIVGLGIVGWNLKVAL